MNTPICDFVQKYVQSDNLRMHMPGHKGNPVLGIEPYDITEITGADSLYEADGIIAESEKNASELFGCRTFYSVEGASHCIRAMLYLAMQKWDHSTERPLVLAGRNAHKSFLSAVAMLDMDVQWLYSDADTSYLSCYELPDLEDVLANCNPLPLAVYLTSPDYLGNMADIGRAAQICHRYGVMLLVDNAHGAYLRFLPESAHPCDLDADICCDSAHKTLPALTGGAYLHFGADVPAEIADKAKNALALFGTTSPSYLILQSLDAVNPYLATYPKVLADFLPKVRTLKAELQNAGYDLVGNEPMKLTIAPKTYGYTGTELATYLEEKGIITEFSDPDYVVLMLTPQIAETDIMRLKNALLHLPKRSPVTERPPHLPVAERVMSVRDAALAEYEVLPVEECCGRILAQTSVGCPPAVPILACGERIDEAALDCFRYYGIVKCCVVK